MKDTPKIPSENTEKPALGKRKTLIFKIMALLLPFFLFGLVETGLRLLDYGQDFSLFVATGENEEFWVMNPHIAEKYFGDAKNATVGNQELFPKKKGANTFRIFVLGASTAIGYPYLHNGSFHRWLQFRLGRTFPDKNFEVINLSLTAINSYTLLDVAKELPRYQPDVVLVYAGHNEYYGAMGVGATGAISGSPYLVRWVVKLREFRVVQGLTHIFNGIRQKFTGSATDLRENLMKRMAGRHEIPYDSEIYHKGIRQYATNMNDMLKTLDVQQIPVLISTIVSNEKDLPPFISDTTRQENDAAYHYRLARKAYEGKDYKKAKELFVKSKELDLLRFRAPEAMNDIIRELSDQYEQVYLVDAEAAFARHSPQGIIGKETLLEHVHPNLFGYALLSDVFYEGLRREKMIADAWENTMSFDTLWQEMPVTELDSLKGRYETMILREGWPFFEPIPAKDTTEKTLPEALAGGLVVKQIAWEVAMEKLYQHYFQSGQYEKAMKVIEGVLLEYPHEAKYYTIAARLSMRLEKHEEAAYLYSKAFEKNPTPDYAQKIAIDMVKMHRLEEALEYLKYANEAGNPDGKSVQMMGVVNKLISLQQRWKGERDDIQVLNQLAFHYHLIGQSDTARWFLERALDINPDDPVSLKISNQINLK